MDQQEAYTGEIRIFAGTFAPVGWAICNGALLSATEHQALFLLIGTTYGGHGTDTFALPDLRSRVPLHCGTGSGLSPRALGEKGGAESVALKTSELARHTHNPRASGNPGNSDSVAGNFWAKSATVTQFSPPQADNPAMSAGAIGQTGKNLPHDNMLPYLPVNFIIALSGANPHN